MSSIGRPELDRSDTKLAVDAALIAQKEAVKEQTVASEKAIAKSEAATSKQLEELSKTSATADRARETSHNELARRVEKIENLKQGGQDVVKAVYGFAGFLLILIALGGVLAAAGAFNR